MKVIVGLGNPGTQYSRTRHNLGFIFIDQFLSNNSFVSFSTKFDSLVFIDSGVIFCKPQTFMNNSGEALKKLKTFYKLKNSDFLVVYDDLYIPEGKFKYSLNSGHGGHNGIKNIIAELGGNDFYKLRIGIGPRERAKVIADYVLEIFSKQDFSVVSSSFPKAFEVVKSFLSGEDIVSIQNKFH